MFDLNLALIGLILSIFYSSSEIALLSANALQLDVWEKQQKKFAKLASSILDKKPEYLSVILIGTNLSNILATSFATVFLINSEIISKEIIILPIAIIILLFGEILPKTILRHYANLGLELMSPLLKISFYFLYPLIIILRVAGWMKVSDRFSSTQEEIEEKSSGGIILTQAVQERPNQGEVRAVGDVEGIEVGDTVVFGKYAGTDVLDVGGESLIFIDLKDVKAVIYE